MAVVVIVGKDRPTAAALRDMIRPHLTADENYTQLDAGTVLVKNPATVHSIIPVDHAKIEAVGVALTPSTCADGTAATTVDFTKATFRVSASPPNGAPKDFGTIGAAVWAAERTIGCWSSAWDD